MVTQKSVFLLQICIISDEKNNKQDKFFVFFIQNMPYFDKILLFKLKYNF